MEKRSLVVSNVFLLFLFVIFVAVDAGKKDDHADGARKEQSGLGIFGPIKSNKDLRKDYEYDDDDDNSFLQEHHLPHPNSVLPIETITKPADTSTDSPDKKLPPVKKKPLDPNRLPSFVQEPIDSFIIRGKSAELLCSVRAARKAYFSCNGEAMAELTGMHKERDFVDSEDGEVIKEVKLEISRDMVEEFFGVFTCQCDAWSAKGVVYSRNVTVETAYLRKEFEVPPYSQSVELGSQIELRCHPPVGKPKPRIYWLRDRVEVQPERDANYIQASDGHLIIIQARETDAANFTCVAENVAATRLSPPARLQVVVTGGWSSWTTWSDCSARCGAGFQRRERFCNNPRPKFGGAYCLGPTFQKNKCTMLCKGGVYDPNTAITAVSGGWSEWSDWSTCNPDCLQSRRRLCDNPSPANGGAECKGQEQLTEECAGGMCRDKRQAASASADGKGPARKPTNTGGDAQEIVETDFSLLVGLSVALAVFLVVTLTSIKLLRKKGRSPSLYTMTNLNYRREFSNSANAKDSKDDEAAKQLLLETTLSSSSCNATPVSKVINGLHYQSVSQNCSPFVDKKSNRKPMLSSALTLNSNMDSPQLKPKPMMLLKSPTTSEHQYDIPFSHLKTSNVRISSAEIVSDSDDPDYDEMDPRRHNLDRPLAALRGGQRLRSHSSNRTTTSSGASAIVGGGLGDWRSNDGSLLGPRLIDGSTGCSPLILPKGTRGTRLDADGWSEGSEEKSTSIYSEESRPVSSMFGDLHHSSPPAEASTTINRNSIASCSIDPDGFVYATVGHSGHTLTLKRLGVSLTIPEGALDKGCSEEVFLAVMTEGRDRPRLSENQTLLSPVVLAGPPRLSFKKPVVLSFGHCANLKMGSWELGVYHCDSLFADADDTPWVKLVTIGQETMSAPILASMDFNNCCIMTDFLTRYCIVGQSGQEGSAACKVLRILVYGKQVSSSLDFHVSVLVIEDTRPAQEKAAKSAERNGFFLLDKPKTLYFQDGGDDLILSVGDCATGWSLKPKTQQTIAFNQIWSGGSSNLRANYRLHHVDPTVKTVAFNLSAFQPSRPETRQTFSVTFDANNSLRQSSSSSQPRSSSLNSSGQTSFREDSLSSNKLSGSVRSRLCQMLDSPQPGQNDWRALSAGLRLERFSHFFAGRSSPTECILGLWEVQKGVEPEAVTDLLNLLRVIGRQDCARVIEEDYGPWM